MANTKSAKKRVKQNQNRRMRNLARRSAIKTAAKRVLAAVEANNVAVACELLVSAESQIARACGAGVLKKNTAARKISNLTKKVAVLQVGRK